MVKMGVSDSKYQLSKLKMRNRTQIWSRIPDCHSLRLEIEPLKSGLGKHSTSLLSHITQNSKTTEPPKPTDPPTKHAYFRLYLVVNIALFQSSGSVVYQHVMC